VSPSHSRTLFEGWQGSNLTANYSATEQVALAMDYYYPMEEHEGLRPAQLPWQWQWQWQWQWRLFSLLSSQPELLQPQRPANHVSWEETAVAHLFSASLPGNPPPHSIPDSLAFVDRCSQPAELS
jgi:hypothetical protein